MITDRIRFLVLGLVVLSTPIAADSFYSEESYIPLVSDKRAARLGDSITILVLETSSAKANTDSSTDRNLGISAGLNLTNQNESGDLELAMNRDSSGGTSRNGQLRAQLSATVTKIDPNGRFFVQGAQTILVNGETQEITIKGWLRPEDIGSNNATLSTRLAEAEITYSGVGDQGETNEPGWIHWFFSKIGLI